MASARTRAALSPTCRKHGLFRRLPKRLSATCSPKFWFIERNALYLFVLCIVRRKAASHFCWKCSSGVFHGWPAPAHNRFACKHLPHAACRRPCGHSSAFARRHGRLVDHDHRLDGHELLLRFHDWLHRGAASGAARGARTGFLRAADTAFDGASLARTTRQPRRMDDLPRRRRLFTRGQLYDYRKLAERARDQ